MNIVLRKLIYNDSDVYLINWNEKPCFIVSELTKALDGIGRDDIQLFLRHNDEVTKGVDYDVIQGSDARILRDFLKDSGVEKKFVHTMVIYFSGLNKYSDYRRTRQIRDFCSYLQNNKIYLDNSTPSNMLLSNTTADSIDSDSQYSEYTLANPQDASIHNPISSKRYSDVLQRIVLMEDFMNSINKMTITPDKSIAFVIDMTKFVEDTGLNLENLLLQLKKWIV